MAVNSEGLLAVTDGEKCCVHLLTNKGALVRSIGEGLFGGGLFGVAFDLKKNIWVTDYGNNRLVKLSQSDQLLQTIYHTHSDMDPMYQPSGVSVSQEGLMYVCDSGKHRITVHDEEGKFLFAFGAKGSGPQQFSDPNDIVFGSDGLVMLLIIRIIEFLCCLRKALLRGVSRPNVPQPALLLLVTTTCWSLHASPIL